MRKNIILFLGLAFSIQMANASVTDSTRAVAVKGATNFRDLGGYTTKQGKQVKWGKIYRSGEISKLTDADLVLLNQRHINFIVDFRGNDEVAKAKDRLPQGAEYLQLPAGSENLGNWMAQLGKLNSADSLMESFYGQTSHLKAKYKPFFQALLKQSDSSALLFHCTAGKDRTGIGAALLLYALGVPEETILDDYLLSNEFRKEENEKMVKGMVKMGIKEQVAKDLAGVKKEYLMATYQAVLSEYGSMDSFLETEMGLSDSDITSLREKYTK
ncbi:protein-tyrosine phosphatase [Pedobacter cryoconitis]|uniref:Protein-tyrosine phosphatase n=1 Tax=Pedobacter cryoconitis TaxID=188932 RepID=A0A7W8ZI29_9SPHI|nr:tyrosine-protein phosphatase [Pedobacter cryoconitis]MBB5634439.1 protein-tyrosine phosphatase [Pedobacter cryoconitis]MBB6272436.1 protein-tyrosine phosphatase [Pedobacter cryoconitis]